MANYQPSAGDAQQAQQEYKNAMETSAQLIAAVTEMMSKAREKVVETWQSEPVQEAIQSGWERHRGAKEQAQEWLGQQSVELPGLQPAADNLPILETPNNAQSMAAFAGNTARATIQKANQTAAQLGQVAKQQIEARDLGALGAKVKGALNSGQLEAMLKQVPVTLRVGSNNVFDGNLSGGNHLKSSTAEQVDAISSALSNPEIGQKPVKMIAGGQPVLLISEGQVLKDDLKLLPPVQVQNQTIDVKAEAIERKSFEDKVFDHIEGFAVQTKDLRNATKSTEVDVGIMDHRIGRTETELSKRIDVLINEVKDLKASNIGLQDRMASLESQVGEIRMQTEGVEKQRPSVKEWVQNTFSTVKAQVSERLQSFKDAIDGRLNDRYQQLKPKLEYGASIANGVAEAVKNVPAQAATEARKQFMTKVGEPAIQSFIRSQGGNDGVISSASTENYSYMMNNQNGLITMIAKDGRGALTPETMKEGDVREVGQIAQQQQKLNPPAQQAQKQTAKITM